MDDGSFVSTDGTGPQRIRSESEANQRNDNGAHS